MNSRISLKRRAWQLAIYGILLAGLSGLAGAEEPLNSRVPPLVDETISDTRAPVVVDGRELFPVRGISVYPAAQRAALISSRIQEAAADVSLSTTALRSVVSPDATAIYAGDLFIMRVFEADAQLDRISRPILVELFTDRIAQAMKSHRASRSPAFLVRHTLYALGITLVALLLGWALLRLFAWLGPLIEKSLSLRIERLEQDSHQLIKARPLQMAVQGASRGVRILLLLLLAYGWINGVLGLFPWTRPLASQLSSLFINPLGEMGIAFIQSIPKLAFLTVLFFVTRYILRLTRLLFSSLNDRAIVWQGFEPEWAWPTYKIVRLLILAFTAIVAYPYIPGSSSEAFKGVSLFLGVIFSLGSSSVIANLIAGYSLTYRRAFKIGDRVHVGEVYGDIMESGLVVTRIKTIKNEEVVVPNSTILNTNVVNYSSLGRAHNLILHTTVGIGYETPWRQVESLLKMAASRTPELLKNPPPYVLQKVLGDFAVTYEINAYAEDPKRSANIYTALHQNILDLFNEYGIQIMTPAYEGDPEKPKVVPKSDWFLPPAAKKD